MTRATQEVIELVIDEIKRIYHKYKPKKRGLPPPEPFEPGEQFLDFVELLDPLAPTLPGGRSLREMYWPLRCPGVLREMSWRLRRPDALLSAG